MRVAMVTAALSHVGGGVSAVVEQLSRAVADTGVEVAVFGPEDEQWTSGCKDAWNGAKAYALPRLGPAAIGYMPSMVSRLVEWAPDVVHTHGIWMHTSRSVMQWSQLAGRPYLVSPHGMLSSTALKFSPLKKQVATLLYQAQSFKSATALHATCTAEIEEIRAYGLKQPIALFANGVEIAASATKTSSEPTFRILSLGRIHPKKGLDRLIRAWAALENEFPRWSLDLVGPDENGYRGKLENLVRSLGLQRVTVRNPVFGQAKLDCLSGAEIFALPTLNENFALTVAESLMCGTPVISTKGAPWQGLETNKCGWWIDHGEAPLTNALRNAMTLSPEERADMGLRGRKWIEQAYSWPTIASEACAVYRWLASPGSMPKNVQID